MSDQLRLDEAVEFAENPEPRCPCVLLLDTSGSMQGAAIDALNEGLRALQTDLLQNSLASRRVEVAHRVAQLEALGPRGRRASVPDAHGVVLNELFL